MSGIEIVGVVLGSIPLVISALEHYKQGIKSVKNFRNYRSTLNLLKAKLKCVRIKYCQTIQGVFAPQVVALDEPGFFKRSDVEIQMRNRLGQDFESFIIIIEEMDSIMTELMDMLQIGTDGKPKWSFSKGRIKWEWVRVRESFDRKERMDQLRELEAYNKNLKVLSKAKDSPLPYTQPEKQSTMMVQYFDRIQNQSVVLHTIVSDSLKCMCSPCHEAYLRLQHPDGPLLMPTLCLTFPAIPISAAGPVFRNIKNIKACISSCCVQPIGEALSARAPHTVSQLEMGVSSRSISSTSPKSSFESCHGFPARRPPSLCSALRRLQWGTMSVGHFANSSGSEFACFEADEPVMTSSQAICLGSLLSENGPPLTPKQRMGIAVKLASAVLQLYNSPWLENDFSSEDLHFFSGDPTHEVGHSVDGPFLRKSFQETSSTLAVTETMDLDENEAVAVTSLVANKTLYHLAILLIELCLNKRLSTIPRVNDTMSNTQRLGVELRNFEIAQQQMETVYNNFGNIYGDVVLRCLRCDFNVEQRLRRLDIVQFRQHVYEGVVGPLKECFDLYNRWRRDCQP